MVTFNDSDNLKNAGSISERIFLFDSIDYYDELAKLKITFLPLLALTSYITIVSTLGTMSGFS